MNGTAEIWTAIATVVIAIFTIVLGVTGGIQAWLTRRAINLASDEFNAAHRPKIVIHSVGIHYLDSEEIDTAQRYIGATITYFNKGRSPAIVKNIACEIFGTPFPLRPGLMARSSESALPKKDVASGEPVYLVVDSKVKTYSRDATFNEYRIFCLGRITYEDARGFQRVTGFIRQFDSSEGGKWVSVPNSGYDYSY